MQFIIQFNSFVAMDRNQNTPARGRRHEQLNSIEEGIHERLLLHAGTASAGLGTDI